MKRDSNGGSTSDARFMAVWLSVLPVDKFNRQQLFAELERLERVIAGYDRLIAAETDSGMLDSLYYCRNVNFARLVKVRLAIAGGE